MIKANSKKAKENLKKYIADWAEDYIKEGYEDGDGIRIHDGLFTAIYSIFLVEKNPHSEYNRRNFISEAATFKDWAQGLALGGLFCYWYNRSAVDDLGDILEQTEAERNKYTEQQAADYLTNLIYTTVKCEAAKEEERRS